jgi:hypothetical protein
MFGVKMLAGQPPVIPPRADLSCSFGEHDIKAFRKPEKTFNSFSRNY